MTSAVASNLNMSVGFRLAQTKVVQNTLVDVFKPLVFVTVITFFAYFSSLIDVPPALINF